MLALIGSGETSPTMVTLHRELIAGFRDPRAVLLATPYAFQVNAAGVSARAQRYFTHSVGLSVEVAAGTSAGADPAFAPPILPPDAADALIRDADWVFAGPGNPSYALAHWLAGPVAAALRDRLLTGRGVTVLASAAAATAGSCAVPVYEIYKAGLAPHWLGGIDLLGALGLDAAVIPHYDNAEGRDYDTRYCYLGETRLRIMEEELPDRVGVLGIDEHTALLIDSSRGSVQVRGRGHVTVRRHGVSTELPPGCEWPLATLRALLNGTSPAPARSPDTSPAVTAVSAASSGDSTSVASVPLPRLMADARRDFDDALAGGDADRMVAVILALECAITDWAADTEEDQGTEQARAILRDMIASLGKLAKAGRATDPAVRLRAAVRPLLDLRTALRAEGRYEDSDTIRDALTEAGLHIQDTSHGPRLHLQ